jgi:hypothetical protein
MPSWADARQKIDLSGVLRFSVIVLSTYGQSLDKTHQVIAGTTDEQKRKAGDPQAPSSDLTGII